MKKKSFLNFILDHGGKLAVLIKQQKTFLRAQQLMKDEVPSLKKPPPHPMEIEQEKYKLAMEDSSTFDFPEKLNYVFQKMISQKLLNELEKKFFVSVPKKVIQLV